MNLNELIPYDILKDDAIRRRKRAYSGMKLSLDSRGAVHTKERLIVDDGAARESVQTFLHCHVI